MVNEDDYAYFMDYYGKDGTFENEDLLDVSADEFNRAWLQLISPEGPTVLKDTSWEQMFDCTEMGGECGQHVYTEFSSFEREMIRDIILVNRGKTAIGYF